MVMESLMISIKRISENITPIGDGNVEILRLYGQLKVRISENITPIGDGNI